MQRTPTCENCQRNYELRDCRPTGNRIPLLLPCGHTFCEGCILKSTKQQKQVSCFICDEVVQLDVKGETGVKTLLPNIYLLGLLLYNRRIASNRPTGGAVSTFNGIGNVIYKTNSSLSGESAESKDGCVAKNIKDEGVLCDECNLLKATCQCSSCDNSCFCEKCFTQVHKASKLLMKHTPLPLEYSSKDQLYCTVHKGRNLEFYDQNLTVAVCAMCIISERCRGHDIILLSELDSESDEKINVAIEKAKDTLFWWDHSSKVLTKALPEEYMEANHLFADIHSKFNALHTILLKRQMELMKEASEKLVASGSIQDELQDLSDKTKKLSALLKDVEMVMKDKGVMQLKSEEFLKKLDNYADQPCIVQKVTAFEEDYVKLNLEDISVTSIQNIGSIKTRTSERFTFQKECDVSEELKEQLKNGTSTNVMEEREILMNEIILEEGLNKRLKKYSLLTGYHELVCVTDVTDPVDFKVQRCADKDRLQVLMTDLNKYCRYANSSDTLIYAVEEGQLVCAQFLSDNNWYRSRVINKWSKEMPDVMPSWNNGLPVEVLYIDYGNTEWLPLTRLRQLPKQFLEIPEMAVTCMLTDIVPPSKGTDWPERSKKAFTSLTGDRPMLMNIRKRVGCKLHVDLRKPDDDEPTRDDDRPISVRDALVFLEVAAFISPASYPNSDMHQPVRKYKPHELLIENEFIDVVVTHIEDPGSVYMQKLNSQIVEEQTRLGKVYNSKNKKGWMIDYPHRNLVCCAKFSADKTWYRAKVINVNHDDTVEVEYVDYGNCENVSFNNTRKIPDMYLELPQQCVKVKLHGVNKPDDEEKWCNESKEVLHKHFLGKPLVAVVKALDDGIPSVEFYDTSTDEDVNMNEVVRKCVIKNSISSSNEAVDVVSEELSKMVAVVSFNQEEKVHQQKGKDKVEFACYLSPVIPTTSTFSATGVHVDEKANIYIHVMDSENSYLTNIMQHLNSDGKKYNKHPKSTSALHPKQAVIGRFSQDKLWYRVEIMEIIDQKKMQVKYIDFGNIELADVCDIYAEAMFPEIAGQCISVQLADIEPASTDGEWSLQIIALLREYIVSEEVVVELQNEVSDTCRKATIYIEDGSSVNDILTKGKLAKTITKESAIKPERKSVPVSVSPIANKDNDASVDYLSIENPAETIEGNATTSPITTIHTSKYLWFSEQRLPKVGMKFDVVVTQVNQPDIIYIQRLPHNSGGSFGGSSEDVTAEEAYNNIVLLESISEVINAEDYFNDGTLDVKPIVGMSCIGKYTTDGLYYRAKIEHLNEEEGVAEVIYVDYGTSEIVPIQSLKPLPPGLVELPMQATKVCLAGIKPLPCDKTEEGRKDMLKDTDWSIDTMKQFYAMVANKRLVAQIVDCKCDLVKIHLYERCATGDSSDETTVEMLVGKKMKECNLAQFVLDENEEKILVDG